MLGGVGDERGERGGVKLQERWKQRTGGEGKPDMGEGSRLCLVLGGQDRKHRG